MSKLKFNQAMYDNCSKYFQENGELVLWRKKDDEQYNKIKMYLSFLRREYRRGNVSNEIKNLFDEIGMIWDIGERNRLKTTYRQQERDAISVTPQGEQKQEKAKHKHNKLRDETRLYQHSFSEIAILYYVLKVFDDAECGYTADWLGDSSLDIYIPSLNIGVEYDGFMAHGVKSKDMRKNRLCEENGIKLIRIRHCTCPNMKSTDHCSVILRRNSRNSGLNNAIAELLQSLGAEINNIDVGAEKDNIHQLLLKIDRKENL